MKIYFITLIAKTARLLTRFIDRNGLLERIELKEDTSAG